MAKKPEYIRFEQDPEQEYRNRRRQARLLREFAALTDQIVKKKRRFAALESQCSGQWRIQ